MFIGIYDAPLTSGGKLLLDATWRASGVQCSTNEHGYERLTAFVRLSLHEVFRLYDKPGLLHVLMTDYGMTVFEGRLEDVSIQGNGIQITAYGYWRSLSDVPYTGFFCKSTYDDFVPVTSDNISSRKPEKHEFDTNGRIYIAPRKGESFANASDAGSITWIVPSKSSVAIIGASFDYEAKAPTNYVFRFDTMDRTFGNINAPWTLTANGAVQTGSVFVTFSAWERMGFFMRNDTGGTVTKATDTGVDYLKITNLRLVGLTTNKVDTTLTANRNAGTSVTATVGSTARMYVGQRLIIGGTVSESVLVESVTNSTQFVATFAQNHVTTNTVQAHVMYPDDIIKSIVGTINGINSSQLASGTTLIQSQSIDLFDEIYEDELPADIFTRLVALGDNQTTPRRWEVGIRELRLLYAQYRGFGARTWYTDITELHVDRTLDTLYNSVYARYTDVNNNAVRATATSDTNSISRYGVTRRMAIDVDTTSSVQASIQQAMVLADKKDPPAKASIEVGNIYDGRGIRQPLWIPRAGDTIVIRNIPPDTSTSIDRIRSFRLSRTEYDADNGTLSVEPEEPADTLTFWLSRWDKGIVGAGGSIKTAIVTKK